MPSTLPIIDVSCYLDKNPDDLTVTDVQIQIATEIGAACRTSGFFYLKGHGISDAIFQQLEDLSKQFFSLSLEEKMGISMHKGGRAWRGYFPPGAELTSGKADQKEGIYFGTELSDLDPRVIAQTPLHGQNLWPDQPDMQKIVMPYIKDVTEVAQGVLKGIALSLGLAPNYFRDTYTADPTVLFRIFNYPPCDQDTDVWGVGEHTDYGLLTLLAQDQHGGLEVYSQGNWISAPPIENYMICNIGDMLDILSAGWYVSTPHRVRAQKDCPRLSFPLFLDPNFDTDIQPLPNSQLSTSQLSTSERVQTKMHRWDNADLHSLKGTYGEYLLNKVSKVFPHLTTDLSQPQ